MKYWHKVVDFYVHAETQEEADQVIGDFLADGFRAQEELKEQGQETQIDDVISSEECEEVDIKGDPL